MLTDGEARATLARTNRTGLELCPMSRFNPALQHLAKFLRPNSLLRAEAGEHGAVLQHYQTHFGRPCKHLGNSPRWPLSGSARERRIIDLGDGTTGTRFLACVLQKLQLSVGHNSKAPRTASLTSFFDQFDAILDSPVPYLTDALLATHTRDQTALMLTVRDPWDWKDSRLKHHSTATQWRAADGGCGSGFTLLGSTNSTEGVARDLLSYWAFALCLAAEREVGGLAAVPVINLFDHEQCGRPIVDPRCVPSGDGAFRREYRSETGEVFEGGIRARVLVGVHHDRISSPIRNLHRHDFSVEQAGRDRGSRFPLALHRKSVLLLATDAELLGDPLGCFSQSDGPMAR